jgi:succinate dehydrogenase / fumarate reductase, flavoprotein subunit
MMIYPATHYTMGGLWVDYNLMSTIDGLFVLGEANFSDHGANRLGASALMQGLADGYFIIPYTIGGYLASTSFEKIDTAHPAFEDSEIVPGNNSTSCCPLMEGAPWMTFIVTSAILCGTTVACPVTMTD